MGSEMLKNGGRRIGGVWIALEWWYIFDSKQLRMQKEPNIVETIVYLSFVSRAIVSEKCETFNATSFLLSSQLACWLLDI